MEVSLKFSARCDAGEEIGLFEVLHRFFCDNLQDGDDVVIGLGEHSAVASVTSLTTDYENVRATADVRVLLRYVQQDSAPLRASHAEARQTTRMTRTPPDREGWWWCRSLSDAAASPVYVSKLGVGRLAYKFRDTWILLPPENEDIVWSKYPIEPPAP